MAKVSLSNKINQIATTNPAAAELLENLSEFQTGADIQYALEMYDRSTPVEEVPEVEEV